MKLSNDFDARCLRPRQPRNGFRWLLQVLALLLLGSGLLLMLCGPLMLVRPDLLEQLQLGREGPWVIMGLGLLLWFMGRFCWRRRRPRVPTGALTLAPNLLKKHRR